MEDPETDGNLGRSISVIIFEPVGNVNLRMEKENWPEIDNHRYFSFQLVENVGIPIREPGSRNVRLYGSLYALDEIPPPICSDINVSDSHSIRTRP